MVYVDNHPYKDSRLVQYIRSRIKRNKNCIIFIVGPVGSGKSYAGLALGEAVDPIREIKDKKTGKIVKTGFDISRVAFTSNTFLELVAKNYPPGSCIMFEEAGVGAGARRSMSSVNVAMSHAFQTIRSRNHVIIITVPSMGFVDKHVRTVSHLLLLANSIDYEKEISYFKIYALLQSNFKTKIYTPHPVMRLGNGRRAKLTHIGFSKPSVTLLRAYEKGKYKFGTNVLLEGKKKIDLDPDHDINLTPTEKKIYTAITRWDLKPNKIAKQLDTSTRNIYAHITEMRRKGYEVYDKRLKRELAKPQKQNASTDVE